MSQTIAFGIFDGCLIGEVKESGTLELSTLNIPNLYAARALAWSGDGTKLAVASQTGAVLQYEAVLRYYNDLYYFFRVTLSATQQGKEREPSDKKFHFPFSAQF